MNEDYSWIFMSLDDIIDTIEYEKGKQNNDRTNDDPISNGFTEQSS